MNKTLVQLLEEIKELHIRKAADYSSSGFYNNFIESSHLVSLFKDPVDQVFASLIGVKLSRIANLRNKGANPLNESLEDSVKDLTTYCAIWYSYIKDDKKIDEVLAGGFVGAQYNPGLNQEYHGIPRHEYINASQVCPHEELDKFATCRKCFITLGHKDRAGRYTVVNDPVTGMYYKLGSPL